MGLEVIGLPANVTDHIANREEKKRYERKPRRARDPEIELHNQFWGFLRRYNFEDVEYSNPRRRTRARLGRPDFLICRDNRRLGIEFKIAPNKLSPEQEEFFAMAGRQGNTCLVCFDYESAIPAMTTFFNFTL